jgi:hypothetical protein
MKLSTVKFVAVRPRGRGSGRENVDVDSEATAEAEGRDERGVLASGHEEVESEPLVSASPTGQASADGVNASFEQRDGKCRMDGPRLTHPTIGGPVAIHYFDSRGNWIAFRPNESSRHLFDPHGRWIGWLAWNDDDVCGAESHQYLGTLRGDRLLKKTSPRSRMAPMAPMTPMTPMSRTGISSPIGYTDI